MLNGITVFAGKKRPSNKSYTILANNSLGNDTKIERLIGIPVRKQNRNRA